MITKNKTHNLLKLSLLSLAVASAGALCYGQGEGDYIVDRFDDGGASVPSWVHDYGPVQGIFEFDPNEDREGGASPGAMKVTLPFDIATHGGDNQTAFGRLLNDTLDLSKFTTFHFSVKVDPGSSRLSDWGNGAFGNIRPYIRNEAWADASVSSPTEQWVGPEAYGAWQDFSMPIDQGITPGVLTAVNRLGAQIWSGWATVGHTNTVVFWLDNIWFETNASPVPTPPPTLVLRDRGVLGLKQFADRTPSYNRQNIRTDTGGSAQLGWVGQPKPVTYSWTVADFPGPGNGGFYGGFVLSPDPAESTTYSDLDWSATNAFFINFSLQGDGSINTDIGFKTNQPVGNSQFAGSGQLVNDMVVASAVGTWTVTFTSDTDFTVTAPGGVTTNASLPADVASAYAGGVSMFLFTGMGNDVNVGQHATLSAVKATGVPTPFDEDLTDGVLDTSFLRLDSQGPGTAELNPQNQVFVTADDAFWLTWNLPDIGFQLISRTDLASETWSGFAPGNILLNGTNRWVKVEKADLPDSDMSFFALVKRTFTKFQILLPGESPAPGTPTGKTGTPTPQQSGVPFEVIVRAVDDAWYPIGGITDQVTLTSTDPVFVWPGDIFPINMVNGEVIFDVVNAPVYFNTPGTHTITASDATDPSKGSDTSAPVTVTQP